MIRAITEHRVLTAPLESQSNEMGWITLRQHKILRLNWRDWYQMTRTLHAISFTVAAAGVVEEEERYHWWFTRDGCKLKF